jgi:WD40 repeat protein
VGYDYDGGSGRIEVWEIGFPGAEPFAVQGLSPGGGSPDGVRDLAFGPSGLQLYMIAPNGALLVYDRDPATGMLTYNTSRVPALFDELLDLACSPQGDALFATARNSDGVVRWALDSAGIPSTAVQYVSTAAAPLEVEVSRDGTRLYFTTAGAYRLHNAQIVGSALGSIQTLVPPGLPRDLSEGPDGRVYVAAHQHDAARVWQRGANGLLTELGDLDADVCAPSSQQPCLDTASAVAVGEDGKSILVAGAGVLFGNPSGGIALIEDQSVIFVDGFEGNGIGRWSASTEVPI